MCQALESYKRAYSLDQTNDLVLKICGLMLELPTEPGRAKHWVEVRLLPEPVTALVHFFENENIYIQLRSK